MTTTLNPYLGFRDTAKPALEFYQTVFGGELTLSTFGEMHASDVPAEQDLIMHGQLESPSGYTLMASDTPSHMSYTPGDTTRSRSAATTRPNYVVTGMGSPTVPPSQCRWRRRPGVPSSAC